MDKRKALAVANIVMWLASGLYTISPVDLVPDILPLIGWVDDLLGLAVTIAFTVYTISVIRKHGVQGLMPQSSRGALPDASAPPTIDVSEVSDKKQGELVEYEPIPIEDIKSL